jgi:hypothetical protein
MPRKPKTNNAQSSSPWDSEVRLLAWLATCVSVISFLFYFQRGEVLLYGDAVAHINIARRVFDSKTPGLLQLGTVWLPLPHLLMIPFLVSNKMWQQGVGGSIPSMVAYVFGVIGVFRLVRSALSRNVEPDWGARVAAWIAVIIYAANPNLIYLQSTAMGEALYLALFVWAMVYLTEAARGNAKALTKCGWCVAGACLTRYDGWFLAAAIAAVVILFSLFPSLMPVLRSANFPGTRKNVVRFVLIAAAAPSLWLAYNAIVYRNPLEFANGPYSAKAIERRSQGAGNPGHPGSGNPLVAAMYFLKSAEANIADSEWLQRAWVLLTLAAALAAAFTALRKRTEAMPLPTWPLLFLLVPLPFYALSVAYGGVPIFIPAWWPFSHYNVRYGLQLLPAFAAALAILAHRAVSHENWKPRLRLLCVLALFGFVFISYASIWRASPISLKEAQVNMRFRKQFETQLAGWLQKLPSDSTLLMYTGDHVGALEQAGIPLNRVINEGNHRTWKQPADPDGLWEHALADPPRYADYVVAFDGDTVWRAVHERHLPELVEIHVTGQARAILYRAR